MSSTLVRNVTRTAVIALMVGFGVAAMASGTKPPVATGTPSAPVALSFDAKTCSAADRAALVESFALAKERVAAGLQVVMQNPSDPRIARWFGDAPRGHIVEVLQSVLRQIDQASTFTVSCNTAYCVQHQPMAYTSYSDRIVGFCAGYFRSSLTGEDSRFGTVIHELSHLAAHTQDHVYGRGGATLLRAKAPERAADNADSYEYFIETLAD
jgi:peptidyl-Lys metalloendopeptidase